MELSPSSFAQRIARYGVARSRGGVGEATAAPAPSPFDTAIEHFAHGRWADAYEELATLADAGHREAARIALLMATRGPRLFGRGFAASPRRRERWQEAASRAGTAMPGPG
jgi:hypothetical protein